MVGNAYKAQLNASDMPTFKEVSTMNLFVASTCEDPLAWGVVSAPGSWSG